MNYLDLAIFLIIGVSVAIGLYSGFLSSLFNALGMLISYVCAWLFYGSLATWFWSHVEWVAQLIHYTEGASRLATDTARASVGLLTPEQAQGIVMESAMPQPFARLILENIQGSVLAGQGLNTMADYFNNTVVYVSVNLLSFAMLFLILYVAFSVAISATSYVVKLPVLRVFDWAAGGLIGLGRGLFLALIACSLIPIVLAVLPSGIGFIDEIIATSTFAPYLLDGNPILEGIRGIV